MRFTRLLRDGGLGLGKAVELTGRLLADQEVSVHLRQFEDRLATAAALIEIGVTEIA